MAPLRAVCIFAPGGGAGAAIERLLATLDEDQRARARIVAWPSQDPEVAALTISGQRPPVDCARGDDGWFAVVDGEVFNAAEVAGDAVAHAGGGAAAVLELYRQHGRDGLEALSAEATGAIWDAEAHELVLFRDRDGVVPGFYASLPGCPGGVVWAPDLATLLRFDLPRALDLRALDYYMAAGYVPAPWTFVEALHKIPPAHVVTARDGSAPRVEPYWRPTARPRLRLSSSEHTAQLRALLEQALRRRTLAGERSAMLLSGGVDSALMLAGFARLLDMPLDTFTFRYAQYEGTLNESRSARRVAQHFGVPHHELEFAPSDVADQLTEMVRSYGEPFSYGLHSYMLQAVAAAGFDTIFSGADGIFLGRHQLYAARYAQLPPVARAVGRALAQMLRPLPGGVGQRVVDVISTAERPLSERFYRAEVHITEEHLRGSLYREPAVADAGRRAAIGLCEDALASATGESESDRFLFLRWRLFRAEHVSFWNQRWARTHGVAVRHPYSDNELLEFVTRTGRYTDKDDIRRLAATLMPNEFADAPKLNQSAPVVEWLRGPLMPLLRDELSGAALRDCGLFDGEVIDQLLAEHERGEADHAWTLWAVLSTVVWQRSVLRLPPGGRDARIPLPASAKRRRHAPPATPQMAPGPAGLGLRELPPVP